VAAINLFSGLGNDYHAAQQLVIWVTGAGCAIAGAPGSISGGFLADHVNRGYLYLLSGIAAAGCALAMALSPPSAPTFTWGVLAYNGAAGISYAAFSALGLQLVGNRNPVASTVRSLFAAATDGAIVYMTRLDGMGYHMFGTRGLLCVDAGLSVAAAIPLLLLVRSGLGRAHPTTGTAPSEPAEIG